MSNEPPAETKFMPLAPPEQVREPLDPAQITGQTGGVILANDFRPIAARTRTRAFRRLGRTALMAAVLAILIEVIAVALGAGGHLLLATGLAWVCISASGVAVLSGLVAVVQHKRRKLALIAIVLGVIGNPLVQVWVLAALGG
jgi:hypothetical protein